MIDKLIQKIQKTGAPIVVGLDPMLKFVPDHIRKAAFEEKGETLEGAAEAVWLFNKAIVDRICDLIPAVKPQIAMYEQFGIPGLAVFRRTVDYCREKGLVVIGDAKRGISVRPRRHTRRRILAGYRWAIACAQLLTRIL